MTVRSQSSTESWYCTEDITPTHSFLPAIWPHFCGSPLYTDGYNKLTIMLVSLTKLELTWKLLGLTVLSAHCPNNYAEMFF